ncbi:sugar porter family MFS transporter [Aeromicrobium chenweiae]|uniref:MFS transporter n=1 Tax=Aeromicrobium chenweiae TaxID=2079793 RepID=A0A2S0WHG8_9ACTN|nr:sugar porter family MFS transporter [Aeromicrobium chenweiae]AWB90779.1 MFS transporter [Aeromicrobium chenweiae]TGN31040.1 MFS transporter [Aeromicrobium chenweiae]
MSQTQTQDEAQPKALNGLMLMVAMVSAVSGLLYGYDTGIISGALLQIGDEFDTGHAMEQSIAAGILLGAVIGALTCSLLSERWGRHKTILLICVVFIVGSLACSIAPSAVLLALARVLLGFAVGGATQTVPMYVAEMAPAAIRGRLVLCFQLAIGVGIVIATLVGASEQVDWRISIGAAAAPALAMLILQLRLPESPRWLVKQGRKDDAKAVLERVRPEGFNISEELGDIVELEKRKKETKRSNRGWSGLRQPWVRPALIVGCGIAAFTQLSGIEMIIYYAPTILTDNGFSTSAALRVSVALGVTYLIMMIVGLIIVDKVGRRRLTLIMVPGAAIALFVLGALFVTDNAGKDNIPFVIACLIVFMLFNAGGLQLMGWLTGSEIYPLAVRGAGTSVQSATLWSTNLLITLTLLTMIDTFGVGQVFWLYGLFNVAAWVFVWRLLPELTGHSLEDIEKHLQDGEFSPKDFAEHPKSKIVGAEA